VELDGYDVIWVYELWALSCVPARLWRRVVWDKDTVMSDGYRHARRLSQRLAGEWIWRYERYAAGNVRHAFVSFIGDVARFGSGNVSALPHGYFPPADTRPASTARNGHGTGPRLGFVGLLSYKPNRLAVMTFASEILPSIRMEPELEDIELWVAGAQLGADDAARLDTLPGVVVLGYVPELADFYAAIDLAIAPMDRGSGSPTKVIEALGYGVPVVGTDRALRGLDQNLRQWCVEVSDSAWPAAVQAGLRLRAHAPPGGEVERCYSWSAVFERTVAPVLEVTHG
jgi:glycosyltransferase involved in cell wall biosynthesis